jgi:3-oxoacyl-[acyl-carrier-protein] synthase II
MSEVVVTGFGLTTAFGRGADRFWKSLLAGDRTPVAPAARRDLRGGKPVAEVPGLEAGTAGSRKSVLLRWVLDEALGRAGMAGLPAGSLVVVTGQAPPMPETARDARWREFTAHTVAGLPGVPVSCEVVHVSNACASAAFALAFARGWLLSGLAPAALVIGASVLNSYELASMEVVRVLTDSAVRPFAAGRDGTAVGEGAGAAILELRETAAVRGIPPAAVLSGVACRVSGEGKAGTDTAEALGCVEDALADAGTGRVDYVHAHATGTGQGDEAELSALEQAAARYSWRDVPVSSHKGAVGHLLHSSCFPGLVAALGVLREGTAPGTAGLDVTYTRPGLRVLASAEDCPRADTVLVNGFGFGGNNAALVLRSPGHSTTTHCEETS